MSNHFSSGRGSYNKALLSDNFSAVLQNCRRAQRYVSAMKITLLTILLYFSPIVSANTGQNDLLSRAERYIGNWFITGADLDEVEKYLLDNKYTFGLLEGCWVSFDEIPEEQCAKGNSVLFSINLEEVPNEKWSSPISIYLFFNSENKLSARKVTYSNEPTVE